MRPTRSRPSSRRACCVRNMRCSGLPFQFRRLHGVWPPCRAYDWHGGHRAFRHRYAGHLRRPDRRHRLEPRHLGGGHSLIELARADRRSGRRRMAKAGISAAVWSGLSKTLAAIVLSPLIGFVIAMMLVALVSWISVQSTPFT